MSIFRYNSPLMNFLNRLGDLMILNILWLVCSLPVITAGAATTALCRSVMDLDEPDQKPLLRRFFGTFRAGIGKSTALFAIWVLFIVLAAVISGFMQLYSIKRKAFGNICPFCRRLCCYSLAVISFPSTHFSIIL